MFFGHAERTGSDHLGTMLLEDNMTSDARGFYDRQFKGEDYVPEKQAEDHNFFSLLEAFRARYGLEGKKCLEVGCGRGLFQDMAKDYAAVDISRAVGEFMHKPFACSSATALPFGDAVFDVIWTWAVIEHVPYPEFAFAEMRRVLKDGGLLLLAPAWQCRSWAALGYSVRPYKDFDWRGKIVKASIPLRDSVLFRALWVFPRRLVRLLCFLFWKKPTVFKYKELQANYEVFWVSDSDAVNSMDPFDAILWFVSRGDTCLSHTSWLRRFFIRTGPLIFAIRKWK